MLMRRSMGEPDEANGRGGAEPFDSSGRTYALGAGAAPSSDDDELAPEIATFIAGIWASVLELPLAPIPASGHDSRELDMRVTVPLSGHRWIRVACGAELGRVIGSHVFGCSLAEADFASSRMAVLELARALANHGEVIEHPSWPWSSRIEPGSVERVVACELWFECKGMPLAVALLCPATTRAG
jgi:hypothetical protein